MPLTLARKLFVVLAIALLLPARTDAVRAFVARMPNGANVPGVAALGHANAAGGGALNAFGRAFAMSAHSWTRSLCLADSDGDGQSNGQELGDPCCVWSQAESAPPAYTMGVSHPGDASKRADPALWVNITCPPAPSSAATTASPSSATTLGACVCLGVGSVLLLLL